VSTLWKERESTRCQSLAPLRACPSLRTQSTVVADMPLRCGCEVKSRAAMARSSHARLAGACADKLQASLAQRATRPAARLQLCSMASVLSAKYARRAEEGKTCNTDDETTVCVRHTCSIDSSRVVLSSALLLSSPVRLGL